MVDSSLATRYIHTEGWWEVGGGEGGVGGRGGEGVVEGGGERVEFSCQVYTVN